MQKRCFVAGRVCCETVLCVNSNNNKNNNHIVLLLLLYVVICYCYVNAVSEGGGVLVGAGEDWSSDEVKELSGLPGTS